MSDQKTPNPSQIPAESESTKAPYEKPSVTSESLTAVAALCNGTTSGGRKATSPACSAGKLKS